MAAKHFYRLAKLKLGHLKAGIYQNTTEILKKILKNRLNGEIFVRYPTLTLKKGAKMNFRVIVTMLHLKSITS